MSSRVEKILSCNEFVLEKTSRCHLIDDVIVHRDCRAVKETFVIVSTAALELLSDKELPALIAHEVGHLYFVAALGEARSANDDRTARVIELKCDLAALVILEKLDIKLSSLISAVKKLIERREQMKIESLNLAVPPLQAWTLPA